jgi:pimeloyl-ACP methyl ester carboxylesterase
VTAASVPRPRSLTSLLRPPAAGPYRPFKTPAARARFLAAYDAALRLWPRPYETREIAGTYGTTHVVLRGPADARPLVLLHGMCMGAPMWYPNAAAWSAEHRLYALDTIGDRNRSVASRPLVSAEAYVAWLEETLDALGLDRVDLAGLSYGGWLALKFALERPERVRRLVLFDPAASLAPLRGEFFLRVLPLMVLPARRLAESYLRWFFSPGAAIPPEMIEQWIQGWKHFSITAAPPTVFADDQLRSLRPPTLLMIGDREVIYRDRDAALGRALRLMPDVRAEFVAGAAHVPTAEQPARVNARVLRFLDEAADGGAGQ